jgi:hypothetical protein
MSRKKNRPANRPNQSVLRVSTEMMTDGRVEVDPTFSQVAIENLDKLYVAAHREDYDKNWEDDHKIAFFLFQVFVEILSQYDEPTTDRDLDPAPGVPSLQDAPVREVIDLDTMPRANATPLN